jgi:3-oxoacyl-[acyl-carrier-protein] synthase II
LPDSSGDGAYRAMNNSIEDANLQPNEIQYINAHGTSTPAGDKAEASAIDKLFLENSEKVCVSSTKSQTGHLLGAAGAVEAIFSIMSLENETVPINLNLENELETKKINFIKSKPLKMNLANILSNSFGFGGTNVSLIFSKFDGK